MALGLVAPADAAATPVRRAALGEGVYAVQAGSEIYVEALPRRGEGLYAFARRFSGSPQAAAEITRANRGHGLRMGIRQRVPFAILTAAHQQRVIGKLFPDDRPTAAGWEHVVSRKGPVGLWTIATWFTGKGENYRQVRDVNALADEDLRPGQRLVVPSALLLPSLRARLPPPSSTASTVAAPAAPARAAATERVPAPPKVHVPAGSETAVVSQEPPAAPPRSYAGGPVTKQPQAGPEVPPAVVATAQPAAEAAAASSAPAADGPAPPRPAAIVAAAPSSAGAGPSPAAGVPASSNTAGPAGRNDAGPPAVGTLPGGHRLEYRAEDEVAIYRLLPGEALYSSVVVRFTGRIHADDVNALAAEIARGSGIVDVTDIAIGYPVKIPFELLQPEFLPAGHPRRLEYEASLSASSRFSNQVTARGLDGVTVVLDAGHGGRDVGASLGGVWESLHVYDIMLRIKRLLETETAATVVPTTRDGNAFVVPDTDVLGFSRTHTVLTDPAYPIEDPTVGVHLRWYLANSVYRRAVARKVDPEKVVFISIHADSLHPSLRGAMVYIPGAHKRGGEFGKSGGPYSARREVREQPRVSFSQRELVRSEGLSRDLAGHLIEAFRRSRLAVHPFKPVRDTIIRNRREWVPAVLRYNAVPAKVLLEVCNLANAEDRELIQTRRYRDAVAAAVVDGLLRYYGAQVEPAAGQVAAAAAAK